MSDNQAATQNSKIDMKLEIVVLPVSDVDRAKTFYAKLGWRLDADFASDGGEFRVIQFTPSTSGCSVIFGKNVTSAVPGSSQGLYLIVSDVIAAREKLLGDGIEISEVFHDAAGVYGKRCAARTLTEIVKSVSITAAIVDAATICQKGKFKLGPEPAVSENPSKRLVEQRMRNRIMDAMSWLEEGAEGVRKMRGKEFFLMFYDFVPDKDSVWAWPKGAPDTMTRAEIDAVTKVLAVVDDATDDIDDIADEAMVIASGWPERIAPVAKAALDLMLTRGCFDEEVEENEPSNKAFEAALRDNVG